MLTVLDAIAADELPLQDAEAAARQRAGRKLMRLLESTAIPPFLAACTLLDRHDGANPTDAGLFTVSGWEADIPPRIEPHDGSEESRRRQAETYQQLVNPVDWLSGLANNALCQSAIALQVLGPNAHVVGDGSVVIHVLRLIEDTLTDGDVALLVAFDPPPGQRVVPPATLASDACAVLLTATGDGAATVDGIDPGAARSLRCVDVLSAVIAAVRSGSSGVVHGVAVDAS